MSLFISFTIKHSFQIKSGSQSGTVGTMVPISVSVIMVEGKMMVMVAAGG